MSPPDGASRRAAAGSRVLAAHPRDGVAVWDADDAEQSSVADSLAMLGSALGLSPRAASLGGALAVEFVPDCGTWPADYDADRGRIRLRRGRGGALAHEWTHRLDHLLGAGGCFATDAPPSDEPTRALWAVVDAARWRPATLAGVIDAGVAEGRLRGAIAAYATRISPDGHAREAFATLDPSVAADVAEATEAWGRTARAMLAALDGFVRRAEARRYPGRVPTAAYAAASTLDAERFATASDGTYWTLPREVLARAIESVVWLRLGVGAHPLLVDPCRRDGAFGGCDPYAVEAEAEAIAPAVDALASIVEARFGRS